MAIFRSLSARVLLGIALLLAISFSLLTWIAQRESREAVLAAQGAAMDQLGQTLAQSVEDFLAQSRDAASLLAGLREIQALAHGEWSDAAGADLAAALATLKAAEDVLVWNAAGQVVASARQGRLQPGAISIADRDYFADTRQGKVHPGRTPVTSRVSGRRIVVVAAPVMEKGAALGGVGLAVDFQAFSERAILSVKVGRQGHVWLRDGQGRVLAHPQARLADHEASAFPCGEMVRGQEGRGVCGGDGGDGGGDGEARFQVWRTLSNGWTLVCAASLDEMGSAARSLRDLLLLLGAGAFAVTLGGLYVMNRHLVIKPLRTLTHFAGEVAAGNLSARLAGWRCCETSELAERLETMVRQLKERLAMSDGVLGGVAQSLPCVVADDQGRISFINQLMLDIVGRRDTPEQCKGMTVPMMLYNDPTRTTRTDQALKTRQRVVGDFTMTNLHGQEYLLNAQANPIIDEDGHCMGAFTFYYDLTERQRRQQAIETKNEALRALALEGGQAAEAVARAVERLTRQVEEASQGAAVQAQRMTDTATAMEEMNATTLEVARGAGQAADRAGKAMEAARRGQQVTLDMEASIGEVETQAARLLDIMRELGSHAEGIGQIITVIKDIADQTNLLALNAAIEAARAGDAGRGFAVVADEVRKLAEKTMHATTEVVAAIGAIQQGARTSMQATETASASIQTATSLAHRSGEALEAIVADMAETAGQVQAIAAASEEQSATSEEINHAVEEVNDLAARAAATMDEAGRAIHELSDQARAMETVTRQLTAQASAD